MCDYCYGTVVDGECVPCLDDDAAVEYFNEDVEECVDCVGYLQEDPTVCHKCEPKTYFYETGLECRDCVGTVSANTKTCAPCDAAKKNEFYNGEKCSVCYGKIVDPETCTFCNVGGADKYADDSFAC